MRVEDGIGRVLSRLEAICNLEAKRFFRVLVARGCLRRGQEGWFVAYCVLGGLERVLSP